MTHDPGTGQQTLKTRAILSTFWAMGLRIVDKCFNFIRLIILAKLLSPDDFGIFGIALLSLSAFESFSRTGIDAALIHQKESIDRSLDTAWSLQLIRSVIVGAVLFALSSPIATFFDVPESVGIIRVVAFTFLIQGLTNARVINFQKNLEFRKYFFYMIPGTIVEFTVAILLAFFTRSVWALVLGYLSGHVVRTLLSFLIAGKRQHFRINLEDAKALISYGKWIWGSGIVLFLLNQGDDIIVGKILGSAALGLYQVAYYISNIPTTEITHIFSQVSFPLYAKLKNSQRPVFSAYSRVLTATTLITLPSSAFIYWFAKPLTLYILGSKWMGMVPALKVLALYGAIRSISASTGPLFQALGRPDIATRIQFMRLLLMAVIIVPLTLELGLTGTAVATLIPSLVAAPIALFLSFRLLHTRMILLLKILTGPVISIAAALLLCSLPGMSSLPLKGFPYLAVKGSLFIAAYLLCITFFLRLYYGSVKNFFVTSLGSNRTDNGVG